MSARNRERRERAQRAQEIPKGASLLDHVLTIGDEQMSAYELHPDRRAARVAGDDRWDDLHREVIGPLRHWSTEYDAAYARGWLPLAQIHPDDRPPLEVQLDHDNALQDWLAENAPALTLEACEVNPPVRPAGKRLLIPGDGLTTWKEFYDDDE